MKRTRFSSGNFDERNCIAPAAECSPPQLGLLRCADVPPDSRPCRCPGRRSHQDAVAGLLLKGVVHP